MNLGTCGSPKYCITINLTKVSEAYLKPRQRLKPLVYTSNFVLLGIEIFI